MAESTDFLYPFLGADGEDPAALLADLATSAGAKATESARLRTLTLEAERLTITAVAKEMAERFARGGRALTFGNGGSSTDAAGFAALLGHPPWGRPRPARCLVDDPTIITALGNDVGFDLVFARQVMAHCGPNDIAVGISTSGNSTNVLTALAEAHARGALTVGVGGYDGGEMATAPYVDHCLVVRADSIHRIQETQAAVLFELWTHV